VRGKRPGPPLHLPDATPATSRRESLDHAVAAHECKATGLEVGEQAGPAAVEAQPATACVERSIEAAVSRRDIVALVVGVDDEVDDGTPWLAELRRLAAWRHAQEAVADRIVADDELPGRPQDVEVRLPFERHGAPGLPGVHRLDETEQWRLVALRVGMARSEKSPRSDDGESHRVLKRLTHAVRAVLAFG
jgi:hypothetical protein